ncbi:DNA translocase FtsK [Liquorilactobacillus sicerae]|uniref:DNA translocase FtsK n=1 Tax=Liquorilactobacillus sicerae TaxID=1416943 RepID=UPI00248155F3
MARRKATRKKRKKNFTLSPQIVGLIFIAWSLLGMFQAGFLGVACLNVFRLLIGDLGWLGLVVLLVWGIYLLALGKEPTFAPLKLWGGLAILLGLCSWLTVWFFSKLDLHTHFINITWQYLWADLSTNSSGGHVGGGLLGSLIYSLTYFLVGQFGSYLAAALIIAAGFCLLTGLSFTKTLHQFSKAVIWLIRQLITGLKLASNWLDVKLKTWHNKRQQLAITRQAGQADLAVKKKVTSTTEQAIDEDTPGLTQTVIQTGSWQNDSAQIPATETQIPAKNELLATKTQVKDDYQLPPISLLQEVKAADQSLEYKKIEHNTQILQQTFKSFGVAVEIKRAILGPSVTKYELHPAVGVKVSKIVNLADDLALALAAKDIRIEAPIPGKPLVGIEVPNQQISTVSFRSIMEEQPADPSHPLLVPIGRDISGKVVPVDLQKMPHLLIAGSTGSGKSVAINCIITSLLMNCRPDTVKLMLIDPKKVELGVYNGVPHLLTPVVTDARKASRALHKLVAEMEHRYELFANTGQRNLKGYNQMIARQNQETGSHEPLMPYIVIVVDELSDLMMVASNEVEAAIIRLAQMARAAGIHMILATQRPSVDVITGLIKANVPSRMAFAVSSGTDSRTIIDTNGAEKLLGRGDMLFLPMGLNKPIRVQGAFISDQDVANVVDFIKQEQTADYDEKLIVSDEEAQADATDEQPEDELFPEVLKLIAHEQACSISMLQRRFRIGYNRAARLVDELETKGIVGPAEGSKPRKVFIDQQPKDDQ